MQYVVLSALSCGEWTRTRRPRTDGRATAGGADGATLPDQTLTERVRLVGENCVATVPSSTALGTECGDAMPSEDADPDVRVLQAQMLSDTTNSQRQAPERWQQVVHRTYISTTAFVDPKHAKEAMRAFRTAAAVFA
ncbi:unnamed protein product [Hyaloperonospora brassicae]|uniref:RxLR effector candidate protein n=1 Tax=Hyaloperonospora brassicae TaxID=162125 RepID=A0AAV0TCD9_HYABA|nr:unnamed protein product [Hyaloperonospora brassicae]